MGRLPQSAHPPQALSRSTRSALLGGSVQRNPLTLIVGNLILMQEFVTANEAFRAIDNIGF